MTESPSGSSPFRWAPRAELILSWVGAAVALMLLFVWLPRQATRSDLSACNALCQWIHGHHRGGELDDAIDQGSARVVEHLGEIVAYCTDIAFFAHAVAETNQGLKALIPPHRVSPEAGFWCRPATASCFAGVYKIVCGLCIS